VDTFVQVAEIWTPRAGKMYLHGGAYGAHHEFSDVSGRTGFAYGEGLPGAVWSSGKPQVWDTLDEAQFVRFYEAKRAGLAAGLGLPIVTGGRPSTEAVVVLLCSGKGSGGGCIERWDATPRRTELTCAGGYYGNLEPLARMSPRMSFQPGHGLPGMTFSSGMPTLIEDIKTSNSFLLADMARECGIETGIGIPFYRGGQVAHVVVLLSAKKTPLAKAFEVWVPDSGGTLRLDQSFYAEGLEEFAASSKKGALKPGQGLPGIVYRTELPQIFGTIDTPPFVRHDAARKAGLKVGVGIPVSNGERVLAVVVLLS
jgi:hypothetical protein